MKATKAGVAVKDSRVDTFTQRYTQNDKGFYVRNTKPSSGTLNEKRIENNLRSLIEKSTAQD